MFASCVQLFTGRLWISITQHNRSLVDDSKGGSESKGIYCIYERTLPLQIFVDKAIYKIWRQCLCTAKTQFYKCKWRVRQERTLFLQRKVLFTNWKYGLSDTHKGFDFNDDCMSFYTYSSYLNKLLQIFTNTMFAMLFPSIKL